MIHFLIWSSRPSMKMASYYGLHHLDTSFWYSFRKLCHLLEYLWILLIKEMHLCNMTCPTDMTTMNISSVLLVRYYIFHWAICMSIMLTDVTFYHTLICSFHKRLFFIHIIMQAIFLCCAYIEIIIWFPFIVWNFWRWFFIIIIVITIIIITVIAIFKITSKI